ncbi:MAG: hypothetical protein AVDCRST_MAG06-1460, partial [uncultured Nocardioides sp.]
ARRRLARPGRLRRRPPRHRAAGGAVGRHRPALV